MVIKIGMIGLSEGNGHPFSFSSIINGFSYVGLKKSGWPGIYDYVRRRDSSEFGIYDAKVTHAWTQDSNQTRLLCNACLIPNMVHRLEDMIDNVDAVIIARDDYETHLEIALPFLQKGLHVFIDKPLSISQQEIKIMRPYLDSGKLMSCAGMRYAKELDEVRSNILRYGDIKLIRGTVLNSWEKYGVHLLDAILNVVPSEPISIMALEAKHASMAITMGDGALLQIDALGDVPKTFKIDIWGTKDRSSYEIEDNFSMFRRTIWHFINSIMSGKPAIPSQSTINIMKLLIAGRISSSENRRVFLNEIKL